MGLKRGALFISALVIGLTITAGTAFAEQWYFYVTNATDAKMTGLYASEDGRKWGRFNLGSGVSAGKTVKLIWDSSTEDESCEQYLKATFSDGSDSKSDKFDFCEDLDDPIVFE
ncbi:MAG: hypothetical protein HY751_08605 [Nitrospinae bacterium]|nr:hypothetical protein [Nitrospinota bacterium]